ncbi:MlaD family protein [Candidatus Sarmatiella mevalonica]|uniref:MlaD family protein n=1 Tax=Candidatus Sarmatiella mevalonica TaxID=2770581 RepID=UPI001923EED7|nr:MlaD family protein [Candidatus Sarmatiella mevalonica]
MKQSIFETIIGISVILLTLLGFCYAYHISRSNESHSNYQISAKFSSIDGVGIGSQVTLSGVKIGAVKSIELLDSFSVLVSMKIDKKYRLPIDSKASISSFSLIGDKCIVIFPGGADNDIADGGMINDTKAPMNLESLIGGFIYSLKPENK